MCHVQIYSDQEDCFLLPVCPVVVLLGWDVVMLLMFTFVIFIGFSLRLKKSRIWEIYDLFLEVI